VEELNGYTIRIRLLKDITQQEKRLRVIEVSSEMLG
jgi:hypothetical protein